MSKPLRLTLLALLALIAIQTFAPLLQVGLITNDDLKLGNAAQDRGLRGVAAVLWEFTRRDGRLDISQLLSWYVPFAVDRFAYFKAVTLGAIAADLLLFALFARVVFGSRRAFFLALLLALVGLQNSWEHCPLTAFPGLFTFSFAYLLGSFLTFQWFLDRGGPRWVVSASLFFVTLCSYEMYIIYAPVFFGLALLAGRSPGRALRATAPHLVAMGVYLAAWLTSHALRTGNYPGTTVAAGLDLASVARVVWQFSVSSLPTYFLFSEKYDFLLGAYQKAAGIRGMLGALTAGGVIKAALVGGLYGCLMLRPGRPAFPQNGRRAWAMIAVAIAYFFLPSVLPGITERYQAEFKRQQLGMQCSYFSLFAWIWAALAVQLLAARARPWFRLLFTGVTGLSLMFASLAVDYTNGAVAEWQARARDRLMLMDEFMSTPAYAALPEDSIIYAPSLWKGEGTISYVGTAIDPRPSMDPKYESYWTFHFNRHGRKRVVVTDRLERIPPDRPGFYYLKHVQPRYERNQYLVFAWAEREKGSPELLVTDQAVLYDLSTRTSRIVGGSLATPGEPTSVELAGGPKLVTTNQFTFHVGGNYYPAGKMERLVVSTPKGLLDVESVFLAGSAPVEQRVLRTSGWLSDGWIEAEARASLQPQGPARLVVDAFVPAYVFKTIGIKEIALTLELDHAVIATRSVTASGRFRMEANVPEAPGELVLRCGPLHNPQSAGFHDDRDICLIVEKVSLRARELGE